MLACRVGLSAYVQRFAAFILGLREFMVGDEGFGKASGLVPSHLSCDLNIAAIAYRLLVETG